VAAYVKLIAAMVAFLALQVDALWGAGVACSGDSMLCTKSLKWYARTPDSPVRYEEVSGRWSRYCGGAALSSPDLFFCRLPLELHDAVDALRRVLVGTEDGQERRVRAPSDVGAAEHGVSGQAFLPEVVADQDDAVGLQVETGGRAQGGIEDAPEDGIRYGRTGGTEAARRVAGLA